MGLGEAISTTMSRFGRFTGRAERDEYFFYVLVTLLWSFVGSAIELLARGAPPGVGFVVESLVLLVDVTLLIPSLALSVRRLHDTDRTGRWVWLWLVPVLGPLVVFVLACRAGTDGVNRHGPPAEASHPDFRPEPSPRDRSPWVAPGLAAAALGVVGVLLLAGYGAVVLARPHEAVTTATGGTVIDGGTGPVTAAAVPRPATCPSPGPAGPTARPTTSRPRRSAETGPIPPDEVGVTVTPDVNNRLSSVSRPLYEIAGSGSRRVRVTLPGHKVTGGADNDGPIRVWGAPAGTEPTQGPVYDNGAGSGGFGDLGGTAGEWDIVVSATSPTTAWVIDLVDTVAGAGLPTFAPVAARSDCSDVVVTTGRQSGQQVVSGHGSRHVIVDLSTSTGLADRASSNGPVSMWVLLTAQRPTGQSQRIYDNGSGGGNGAVVLPGGQRGRYGLWVQTLDESTAWEVELG